MDLTKTANEPLEKKGDDDMMISVDITVSF